MSLNLSPASRWTNCWPPNLVHDGRGSNLAPVVFLPPRISAPCATFPGLIPALEGINWGI